MPRKKNTRIEWTEERLALLGKQTDTSLADQLGVSWSVVRVKRKALGIPRFDPLKALLTDRPELIDKLGVLPDIQIASLAGVSRSVVRRFRNSIDCKSQAPEKRHVPEAVMAYLGTASDVEVAKRFGVSASAIYGLRRRRGIPRFDPLSALFAKRPELFEQLGVKPDSFFAELAGVSLVKIRRYRRAIGCKSSLRTGWVRPSSALAESE
ncbi:hypothetical protein [Stutzerimonas stutzeri]|uniref:hypothetical protein n=1 Tax=Stutzerimonas stutzeri TaxID=316 RepID=UPI0015E3F3F1|nr:hypothetical protein [Stutzerimonas stutzeri]MBA1280445.1 hypothetical protein [Stutzerimonas stutzeri]